LGRVGSSGLMTGLKLWDDMGEDGLAPDAYTLTALINTAKQVATLLNGLRRSRRP